MSPGGKVENLIVVHLVCLKVSTVPVWAWNSRELLLFSLCQILKMYLLTPANECLSNRAGGFASTNEGTETERKQSSLLPCGFMWAAFRKCIPHQGGVFQPSMIQISGGSSHSKELIQKNKTYIEPLQVCSALVK